MRNPLGTLLYLIIGYLCGLAFQPDLFSTHLPSTSWGNIWVYIWVYIWLLGWPFMLLYIFIWPLLATAIANNRP